MNFSIFDPKRKQQMLTIPNCFCALQIRTNKTQQKFITLMLSGSTSQNNSRGEGKIPSPAESYDLQKIVF